MQNRIRRVTAAIAAGAGLVGLAAGGACARADAMAAVESGRANPLTLEEAIRLALVNNPALRASGGRAAAAAARAIQARLWPNPELELGAEEWPVSGGGRFSDAKQTIGVIQTLPFPGKKPLDGRISDAETRLSGAALSLHGTELVRDVKAAFFGVLTAERSVGVAGELAGFAESSAVTARQRVEAGATAYQEQLRAEIQLEQARAVLSGFRRDLAVARQSFAALLGRPDLRDAPLSGALVEHADPEFLREAAEAALAEHPSLAAARADLDRAKLEKRRARLDPYPDLKVGVAGGRMGETDQSIVEFRFSLPLPIIDRSQGRRQQAAAQVAVAEAELESVRQQLGRELARATQRYRAAMEQVALYQERILPKAGEALRLVQVGFAEGKFNFIDLLDTQRTTAEARLVFQGQLLELNIAQAELEALLRPQTFYPFAMQ